MSRSGNSSSKQHTITIGDTLVLHTHALLVLGWMATHRQGRDTTTDKPTIPITVRQLEAIIRISESIAKMRLSRVVTKDDVAEAVRLFQVSTMHAAQTGGGELR